MYSVGRKLVILNPIGMLWLTGSKEFRIVCQAIGELESSDDERSEPRFLVPDASAAHYRNSLSRNDTSI